MNVMNPTEAGFDAERLSRLSAVIESDIAAETYDGCELIVARSGCIAYRGVHGFADRSSDRKVVPNQIFCTMSVGKQFTVALVLNRIERGDFAFTTRVADIIPEFGVKGKGGVTVAHLLTHTAGVPAMLPMMPPELVGNLEAVVAATSASLLESPPGSRVVYSVIVGHAVLAELVRRVDAAKRPYRRILHEDLFEPLGMHHTCIGLRDDLRERMAPVVVRDRRPGLLDAPFLESVGATLNADTEVPAGGYVSTAPDLHRFAEMLRRGGELDGFRLLSSAILECARVNRTGALTNSIWDYSQADRHWQPFPANLGLGFFLRGEGIHPTPFGTLASADTFGGFGAGSAVFWIDPRREVTYAFLSSGLMEETHSCERHQRLSDLVHSALI